MKRFVYLLKCEFKLAITALPIQIIAILQPTVLFLLMGAILVEPTFDMNILDTNSPQTRKLIQAMQEVGSPIGDPYINPIMMDPSSNESVPQIIDVISEGDQTTAIQQYSLIDSNLVKNFRNRLTSAGLRLWDEQLGSQVIKVQEHPLLPMDVPFKVYFGMALLPAAVFIAAIFTGSVLTGQDFEFDTIAEYRLTPYPYSLPLAARLTRLLLTGLIGGCILVLAIGFTTGYWPLNLFTLLLILTPIGLSAAGLGVSAGLLFKRTIPGFVICLALSFALWILGSAFGLAQSFGGLYSALSSLTINTHTVYLIFKQYYGFNATNPLFSTSVILSLTLIITLITTRLYHKRLSNLE